MSVEQYLREKVCLLVHSLFPVFIYLMNVGEGLLYHSVMIAGMVRANVY